MVRDYPTSTGSDPDAPALAIARALVFVIAGSLYPVPAYPYDTLPYLFAGYLALVALWYLILYARAPGALVAMQEDREN
jgi:hypothetical protein